MFSPISFSFSMPFSFSSPRHAYAAADIFAISYAADSAAISSRRHASPFSLLIRHFRYCQLSFFISPMNIAAFFSVYISSSFSRHISPISLRRCHADTLSFFIGFFSFTIASRRH